MRKRKRKQEKYFLSFFLSLLSLSLFSLFTRTVYLFFFFSGMNLQDKYPKCQAYPPVPNWYTSYVAAIIEPHFFVYATRNIIVILGLKDFRYFNSIIAAKEKINAIDAHDVFCYVGGADKTVRVWNIVANSLTTSHAVHKVIQTHIHAHTRIQTYTLQKIVQVVLNTHCIRQK